MKNRTGIKEPDVLKNKKPRKSPEPLISQAGNSIKSFNDEIFTSEGNNGFKHYIEWLGLLHYPEIVVLSSIHHYYYDADEMKNVRTVVNLRELNQIKEIGSFLNSMFLILPTRCYFIGCFVDNKKQSGLSIKRRLQDISSEKQSEAVKNGIASRIPILNTIFSILDAKTNKYLSDKNVTLLLKNNGFNVIDMTEFEAMTYFCAQSQRMADS